MISPFIACLASFETKSDVQYATFFECTPHATAPPPTSAPAMQQKHKAQIKRDKAKLRRQAEQEPPPPAIPPLLTWMASHVEQQKMSPMMLFSALMQMVQMERMISKDGTPDEQKLAFAELIKGTVNQEVVSVFVRQCFENAHPEQAAKEQAAKEQNAKEQNATTTSAPALTASPGSADDDESQRRHQDRAPQQHEAEAPPANAASPSSNGDVVAEPSTTTPEGGGAL